jgi:ABC-type sugar transport system substrate-binding protein
MKGNHMLCAAVAACLLLAAAAIAAAHDRDQKRFEKLYYDYLVPDTDLYYASCKVCHINKRKLNSYGRALRRAKKAGKEPKVEIYLAVEEKDSDFDGVENGEEIRLGTKPGDPDSHP